MVDLQQLQPAPVEDSVPRKRRHYKGRNRHHFFKARSRGGVASTQNLLLMHIDRHAYWHKVFGNMGAEEVLALLTRVVRAKRNQSDCGLETDKPMKNLVKNVARRRPASRKTNPDYRPHDYTPDWEVQSLCPLCNEPLGEKYMPVRHGSNADCHYECIMRRLR